MPKKLVQGLDKAACPKIHPPPPPVQPQLLRMPLYTQHKPEETHPSLAVLRGKFCVCLIATNRQRAINMVSLAVWRKVNIDFFERENIQVYLCFVCDAATHFVCDQLAGCGRFTKRHHRDCGCQYHRKC